MVRYGGSNLHYIHDSKVDFLKNAEPFHYFRMRVIQESSVSVWRDGSIDRNSVVNGVRGQKLPRQSQRSAVQLSVETDPTHGR